jgi:hypothetical protein
MTISLKRLSGWDEYHETHTPFTPGDGNGILWIPKDIADGFQVSDNEEFIQALLDTMKVPLTKDE